MTQKARCDATRGVSTVQGGKVEGSADRVGINVNFNSVDLN